MPKCDQITDNFNGHAKIFGKDDKASAIQRFTGSCNSKVWNGRGGFPSGRTQQLVSQCKTVNHESIHASTFVWTEHIIFKNIYTHMVPISISEKEAVDF